MAKFTIKQILLSNQNWWNFYNKHQHKIRFAVTYCIVKLLSCKNIIRGYRYYVCSNQDCSHTKIVAHTCKCKACSSCGKKASELWIAKQNNILPNTSWQHITFTMPSELWDFFWLNRKLFNKISKLAADCINTLASKKNILPGMFTAMHSFGRDLKRNVHVHLSTTNGGLHKDTYTWKNLFFPHLALMKMWRYKIIDLFRQFYNNENLIIPKSISQKLNHSFTFNQFLDSMYKKTWVVHCSKPSNSYKNTLNYFSRYIKRPAIAESKLKHYDGSSVIFKYLDHKTKTFRNFTLTPEQFIARFIQHIPDQGFRMIRYYGFLANRVRGKLLPTIYKLLEQENKLLSQPPTFTELIQKNFNFDPLSCILCGKQLILASVNFGECKTRELLNFHRELALLKKI